MQHSYAGSEQEYAWIGDIAVDAPRPPLNDEIMEIATRIEEAGDEICLKVFPDFSLVLTDEENIKMYNVARFLHYSRIRITVCPYAKGQASRPSRGVRTRITMPRGRIMADPFAPELPEPYYPEPIEEDDIP